MTEETKVCSKCGLEKPLSHFYFRKYRCENPCKSCKKDYNIANTEKIRERRRRYRIKNKDKLNEKHRKYHAENKDKLNEKQRVYYKNNKQKLNNMNKKYRIEHKSDIREYYNSKRIENIGFRLSILFRNRVREAIKNQRSYKAYKSMELLGCSVDECRKWLEGKFLPGMTWDNYGKYGWHIDHIIPCAFFDLTKPEEQLKCFHHTNLQPLWWEDNLSKKDKIQVLTSEGVFLV